MNVLVLSITAGQGHHSTGKAIVDYIEAKGHKAKMVDAYEYISPVLSEAISKGYLLSTKYTPGFYGRAYRLAELKYKDSKSFQKIMNSILSKAMISLIMDYEPNVIVCTHIMAAQIITAMKHKHLKKEVITMGIITDYTIHPYWEETDLDYYITASELLNNQIKKKGIPLSKVKAFGIPIHKKFAVKISQKEARKQIGIEDKTTIFVISGSMGYGNIVKHIKAMDMLDLDFQIIAVCGYNTNLRKKISNLQTKKKIYCYGFVDNVDIIMDASDCIITKPGGLTVSESMAKGIPMILINPIPGQEDRNTEFLLNNGLAQKVSTTFPIDEAIFQFLTNKWRGENLEEGIRYIGKPNSTKDLCEFILSFQEKEE